MFATVASIEFAGQPAFNWWAVVVGAIGIALIVYAVMLRREGRRSAPTAGHDLGRSAAANLLDTTPMVMLFGIPAWLISAALGVCTLLVTGAMIAFEVPAGMLALLWTTFLAISAIWLFYHRVYRYLPRVRIITLCTLRITAMLLLIGLLFKPILARSIGPGSKVPLAVVIDASGSMSISDQPNEPNRYRQCVLAVQNVLVPRLSEHYTLSFYAYDGKHAAPLPHAEDLDTIPANGTTTDLLAAIGLGSSGGATQIVLFSDGIHNGPRTVASGLSGIGTMVHTVRVGSSSIEPSTVPDIAVVAVDGPQTATVNNQVVLTASIKSTAMSDRTIRVLLMNGPTQLDEQRLVLRSGPTPQTVKLKLTPDKVGRMIVRVQVPVDPSERSEANNQQDFPLLVTDPHLPVLYVEGRVRPEVGPLRRVLEQDPNFDAISMVQTQAGKFDLRGVKAGDDLRGLPTTLAQWKRFKVIILGDLDASFLNLQQQRDLQTAVRDGTGLLMIGGQNSFAPGGWGNTAMMDLLPVSLARVDPAQINAPFVPKLTAEGVNHSIFANLAGYFISPEGKASATQMPQLSGCVAFAGAKPGANILAVHPTASVNGAPAIVLAVQQVGKGRSGAFAADTTWRWNLFLRSLGKDSPYNRFWGQMVRWLAGQEDLQKKSGPSVAAMIPKERYEPGEPVVLRAAVTDKEGQATRYASVFADIVSPDGKTAHVPMSPVEEQLGVYEATYHPQLAGEFKVTFGATKDGQVLGKDGSGFSILQAAGEMEVLAAQPSTLMEISQATHGDHVDLAGVEALAERLANRTESAAAPRRVLFPSWKSPVVGSSSTGVLGRFTPTSILVFLAIAALTVEVFLRRKWQLQ